MSFGDGPEEEWRTFRSKAAQMPLLWLLAISLWLSTVLHLRARVRELESQLAELRSQDPRRDRTELVYNIAHSLSAPIASIHLGLEALVEGYVPESETPRHPGASAAQRGMGYPKMPSAGRAFRLARQGAETG